MISLFLSARQPVMMPFLVGLPSRRKPQARPQIQAVYLAHDWGGESKGAKGKLGSRLKKKCVGEQVTTVGNFSPALLEMHGRLTQKMQLELCPSMQHSTLELSVLMFYISTVPFDSCM